MLEKNREINKRGDPFIWHTRVKEQAENADLYKLY